MKLTLKKFYSIAAILSAVVSLTSCSVSEMANNSLQNKTINAGAAETVTMPRDLVNPSEDINIAKDGAVVVSISKSGEFLLKDKKVTKDELKAEIKRLAETALPDKRIVYVKSAAEVNYEKVIELAALTRAAGIELIGLIVGKKDSQRPSRFEVKLPEDPSKVKIVKPNPLTLFASLSSDGKIRINAEEAGSIADTNSLQTTLGHVFKGREDSGVFREGTNEVEKAVFIKAPLSAKYGDVVKLIDAVAGAGANPITLQIDDLPK